MNRWRKVILFQAQKERLTAFVMSQGWDIAGYYVDEGISAKDMKREQLIRMIADVKKD